MSTITAPTKEVPSKSKNVVEMNWDPITRIVGSLGIFTKIDFANKHVVECHSTSSIFRGYSIFMKGKDPRDAHFITSRICGICGDNHATCATYAQNMAFGVRPPALGEWIVNLGEAAEYMFDHNIFQDNLVGVDFRESGKDLGAARQPARFPDDRRYHAGFESLHGLVLSRSLADEPHDPRDVLPNGGAPRSSVDSVSRRCRHRADNPTVYGLSGAADEVRRIHEEGCPSA